MNVRWSSIEDTTIGESVSWRIEADEEGNAVAVFDEDEATVKRFYESWKRSGDDLAPQ